jgi:hypothetical protein
VKFKLRVDKLEKAISDIQFAQGGIRVCFQEHGQTQAQAMEGAGIEPDDNALTIFVMHWSEKPLPGDMPYPENTAPTNLQAIDRQIEQVKRELLENGMTGRELAEIEADIRVRGV